MSLAVDVNPLCELDELAVAGRVEKDGINRPGIECDDRCLDQASREFRKERTALFPVAVGAGEQIEDERDICGTNLTLDQVLKIAWCRSCTVEAAIPDGCTTVERSSFVIVDDWHPRGTHAAVVAMDAPELFHRRIFRRPGKPVARSGWPEILAEDAPRNWFFIEYFRDSLRSPDGWAAAAVLAWNELFDHGSTIYETDWTRIIAVCDENGNPNYRGKLPLFAGLRVCSGSPLHLMPDVRRRSDAGCMREVRHGGSCDECCRSTCFGRVEKSQKRSVAGWIDIGLSVEEKLRLRSWAIGSKPLKMLPVGDDPEIPPDRVFPPAAGAVEVGPRGTEVEYGTECREEDASHTAGVSCRGDDLSTTRNRRRGVVRVKKAGKPVLP